MVMKTHYKNSFWLTSHKEPSSYTIGIIVIKKVEVRFNYYAISATSAAFSSTDILRLPSVNHRT